MADRLNASYHLAETADPGRDVPNNEPPDQPLQARETKVDSLTPFALWKEQQLLDAQDE
jgi:hypothetical protein